MSGKELRQVQKCNAVVNAIDRVIAFGLQKMKQATTDDLKVLRAYANKLALEIIEKNPEHPLAHRRDRDGSS